MSKSKFESLQGAIDGGDVASVVKVLVAAADAYTNHRVVGVNGGALSSNSLHPLKADVNIPDKNGCTPLHIAAQKGHVPVIKVLCASGADVNVPDEIGCTPVYMAAQAGHVDAIHALSALGADVNIPDKNGCSPVYVAAEQGNVSALKALCSLGANVNISNNSGCTPVYIAAQKGHVSVINALCVSGADANGSESVEGAARSGHDFTDAMEALCAVGSVGVKSDASPANIDAHLGHVDAVDALCALGVDAHISNKCNTAQNGHVEAIRTLSNLGVDAHISSNKCNTAQNGHVEAIRTLSNLGVDAHIFSKREGKSEPLSDVTDSMDASSNSSIDPIHSMGEYGYPIPTDYDSGDENNDSVDFAVATDNSSESVKSEHAQKRNLNVVVKLKGKNSRRKCSYCSKWTAYHCSTCSSSAFNMGISDHVDSDIEARIEAEKDAIFVCKRGTVCWQAHVDGKCASLKRGIGALIPSEKGLKRPAGKLLKRESKICKKLEVELLPTDHRLCQNKSLMYSSCTGKPNGDYRKRCTFCRTKTSYFCRTCSTNVRTPQESIVYLCMYGTECYKFHNANAKADYRIPDAQSSDNIDNIV